MTDKELVRVQLLMDKKLFEQLRKYAFDNRTTHSETARKALKKFLQETY